MAERDKELLAGLSEQADAEGSANADADAAAADAGAAAAPSGAKKKNRKKKSAGAAAQDTLPSFPRVAALLPWTIKTKPGRGRCAVATREIAAGELVLRERAVAAVPRDVFLALVCSACLCSREPSDDDALSLCSRCAGSGSRREAAALLLGGELGRALSAASAAHGVDSELLRLIAAVYLSPLEEEEPSVGEKESGAEIRATAADVASLHSPAPARAEVAAACAALSLTLPGGCSPDTLARFAAVVNGNAHGLGSEDGLGGGADVAVGLFPFLSMLNHSCAPNAVFATAAGGGSVMCVRASRRIKKDEELCVAYIDVAAPRAARRAATLETKGFECTCERCATPLAESCDRLLEGGACLSCTDVCIPSSPEDEDWRCCGCGRSDGGAGAAASRAAFAALALAMDSLAMGGAAGRAAAEPQFEAIMATYGPKLSPHHAAMLDCRAPLLNGCRGRGDAVGAATHCAALVGTLEAVSGGGVGLEMARFLVCLGELYCARPGKVWKTKGKEAFSKAAAMRTVCLGPEHPLVVEAAQAAQAAGRG